MAQGVRFVHFGWSLIWILLSASLCSANAQAQLAAQSQPKIQQNKGAFSSITWKKWSDHQGSSVDVPISIVAEVKDFEVTKFRSADGLVNLYIMTVTETRPGFPGNDPEGDMNLRRSDCDGWPPKYKISKANIAAFSCTKGPTIKYYVAKYNSSGEVSLYAEYPAERRAMWDRVVRRMARSLHQIQRKVIN